MSRNFGTELVGGWESAELRELSDSVGVGAAGGGSMVAQVNREMVEKMVWVYIRLLVKSSCFSSF